MSDEEAIEVVKILATADYKCPQCVGELIELWNDRFPEHPVSALPRDEYEIHGMVVR